MRVMVLLVAIAACGGDERETLPDAGTPVDALPFDGRTGLPDDGFGFACRSGYSPNHLITACTSSANLPGFCDVGICRRRCFGDKGSPRTCPAGQRVVPIIENECVCEPVACDLTPCQAADLAP